MSIKKFFFFFFFCSLFSFVSSHIAQPKVLAGTILFQDDFNDGDAESWTEINGTGGWEVINGEYIGTVTLIRPERPAFSFTGDYSWNDYRFEFDIKSISGVDKGIIFRYQDLDNFYVVNIRSMSVLAGGNDIVFQKISSSRAEVIAWIPFVNYENTWYHIKIVLNGPNIEIYIDNNLKVEYTESEDILKNGKIGLVIWPGGHTHGDGDVTTLAYDNIVVSTLQDSYPPDPIVLLPGLGASWNHEDMILEVHKDPEDWYMTLFVKAYDGFIQTLKNAGYEDTGDNRNLFIFNYDWRQPIDTIAAQLDNYIENTVDPPSETKIDFIGHSLGGMVARTYVQNDPDHQIDQLITLGSPHKGAPQVYYLWEGADLNRALSPAWQRIGAGILLQLNKKDYKNNVETIRQIIPGLKDLLPTFSFLKQDGVEKPLSEMSQRNNWLESLDQLPLPGFLTSVLNTILGVKENSTLRWINIVDRNRFDRFLGKWEDGKPIGEEFNDGDETVLVESAQLNGANVVELSGLDHGDLVETTTGQQAIVDLLELSPSEIVQVVEINYEPSLVFQLASPATITVFGPGSWQIGEGVTNNVPDAIYSSEDKLIVIPTPKEGNYQVQVNKEGAGGDFRLLIGKLLPEGDIWQEIEGETDEEPKIFTTSFSEDPSENKLELLNLVKQRLELMREKVLKSRKPFKFFLASVIKWKVRQINKAIRLLQKGKEQRAQRKVKETIFSLIFFEKNLKYWTIFYPPEFQQELLEDIRIAKDYLIQAYELE